MSEQTQTALAIPEADVLGNADSGMAIFGNGARAVEATNFDPHSDAGELEYLAAASGTTEELQSAVGKTIAVRGFICRPGVFVSRTSKEKFRAVRTVIVTADGKRYGTLSDSAYRLMATLERTKRGGKPYDPPVYVQVSKQKTSNGNECIALTPVAPPTANGKGK